MSEDEADHSHEDDRGDGEQHRLLNDHPESVALEQELEIPEADKLRHRLVQSRQMHGIERRVDHQTGDDQNQWQREQKRDHRFTINQSAAAHPSGRRRYPQIACYGIGHAKGLLILAPAGFWPLVAGCSMYSNWSIAPILAQLCENASPILRRSGAGFMAGVGGSTAKTTR